MVFCFAKWILLLVLHLAWVRLKESASERYASWSPASPDGFYDWFHRERWYLFTLRTAACSVALIRPGLRPAHLPPRGRLSQRRPTLVPRTITGTTQSLPLGGRWTRSGRMRAALRTLRRRVPARPRKIWCQLFNHLARPDTMSYTQPLTMPPNLL